MMHTLLLLLALACGTAEGPPPEVPEPWSAYALPLAGSQLQEGTATSLVVTYAGGHAGEIGERWSNALKKAGFEVGDPMRLRNVILCDVKRDGKEYTLGVVRRGDQIEVHLNEDGE